jgi:hypothetical protein
MQRGEAERESREGKQRGEAERGSRKTSRKSLDEREDSERRYNDITTVLCISTQHFPVAQYHITHHIALTEYALPITIYADNATQDVHLKATLPLPLTYFLAASFSFLFNHP